MTRTTLILGLSTSLLTLTIGPGHAEEGKVDCYFVSNTVPRGKNAKNASSICKPDYFLLPMSVFEDEASVSVPIPMDNSTSPSLALCCPVGKFNDERLGPFQKPFLWPNEIKGTLSRAFMKCRASNIPGLDTIRFLLYTKKTLGLFDYDELYLNDPNSFIYSNFMKEAPVKIIIHGFMSSAFVGPAPTLRTAYAKIPDKINIVAVHWEALANLVTLSDGICYDIASKSTKYVGRKTAELIEYLVLNNYTTLEKVHVMGHSLGAHCAGFVGKFLRIGRLQRITAFDPARPGFVHQIPTERLSFDDADFIDVIHTATKQWKLLGALSLGFLPFPVGIETPLGNSDFYPNHGTHQPGCIFQLQKLPVLCSHSRSYVYYADSIRYRQTRIFLSSKCDSLEDVKKGSCNAEVGEMVIMGEYIIPQNSSRNLYYVKTNPRSPFPVTLISTN